MAAHSSCELRAKRAVRFIVTCQHKGEPVKDWLICWSYKSALAQAHYRTKLDCGNPIKWGVRVTSQP